MYSFCANTVANVFEHTEGAGYFISACVYICLVSLSVCVLVCLCQVYAYNDVLRYFTGESQYDDDDAHGPSEAATYLAQGDPLLTVS